MMISVVRPPHSPPPLFLFHSPKSTPSTSNPTVWLYITTIILLLLLLLCTCMYVYEYMILLSWLTDFFSPPQQHIVPATLICDGFFTPRLLLYYSIQRVTIILISYYDDGWSRFLFWLVWRRAAGSVEKTQSFAILFII